MIERLHGRIVHKTEDALTMMIGGVGLRVFVPSGVLNPLQEGESTELYTHLVVRETELTLYGFESEMQRQVFETLLKVNGVGPKVGLAILSTLTIDHLRDAVGRESHEVLTRVPGVGKKMAQKLILELKDKIGWKLGMDAAPVIDDVDTDVLATLTALGYSVVEAQSAIQTIPPNTSQDVEERVRVALQYFA